MKINKIIPGFVIQTFNTESGKFEKQEFVAGESSYESVLDGAPMFEAMPKPTPYLAFDMVQPSTRKAGEHLFADCGGTPKCVTCGCDEDDAYAGGEVCSFEE